MYLLFAIIAITAIIMLHVIVGREVSENGGALANICVLVVGLAFGTTGVFSCGFGINAASWYESLKEEERQLEISSRPIPSS